VAIVLLLIFMYPSYIFVIDSDNHSNKIALSSSVYYHIGDIKVYNTTSIYAYILVPLRKTRGLLCLARFCRARRGSYT